ncbi:hypothetical protein N7G274_005486 [Stereocaulon virgatum]|uniref:GPI inositol-deacylase n=1 Tax=Stereocaulon virgatum TaxID=373712 RepID=A0ABR4AB39_9LECA
MHRDFGKQLTIAPCAQPNSFDEELPRRRSSGVSSGFSGLSYLEQKFKELKLRRQSPGAISIGDAGNNRGPFGLTLLHAPSEPLIDFIFVHGLRGGSFKTWRKKDEAQYFWPQAWLPLDPDLHNVRIHTFGYNSDWTDTKDSILNVHDFGRALLGEMIISPNLRKDERTPIVLIGHSMGGLVIKKAYILAQQQDNCHNLASRMRCTFFLATPHRGSDSASLLNNILRSSGAMSARPYIEDLGRNSVSLQNINEEFRHYAERLNLWSFYETLKTSFGVTSALIVDKDSATLGYKHERVQLLNANHRGVCKFDSPSDPDFVTLRNALVTTVDDIVGELKATKNEERRAEMRSLRAYLNVTDKPDDDLANQEDIKTSGSCRWIEERGSFNSWRDLDEGAAQLYWVSAKPATGKSVLAAHVIAIFENEDIDCSYYFFKHGNKAKQVLSGLLRSIAYQMALLRPQIRRTLLSMQEDNIHFDKDDERAIWRKLFVGGIFRTQICRPQYWVIDALDECINYTKLFPLLGRIESVFPLRIFVTSRFSPDLERHFTQLGRQVLWDHISVEDTLADIRLYLEAEIQYLQIEDEVERERLKDKILVKSAGCFLWVRLVFKELENVWSEDQFTTVLEEMPMDMGPFYERTLNMMSNNVREKRLAQAILAWTVCSIRPLKIMELQHALQLDSGITVRNLEKSIEALCGQLLYVDKYGTVQMVHTTARDFLLDSSLSSEFAVRRDLGNERLAMTCLKYLSGDEMRPPRNRKLTSRTERHEFADYACIAFSEHLAGSPSAVDNIMVSLDRFLKTNATTWIEYIARKKNLYYLTRTAKNFRTYLERRAKYVSPLAKEVHTIDGWAIDLIRLVAKFGSNLLNHPSSVYFLIPPFCPSGSKLYQHYGRSPGGLTVVGLTNVEWEDCISYIAYQNTRATALACGENLFAIGHKSGHVFIYHQSTCQVSLTLRHGEPVKLLLFENINRVLASSGRKLLKLWNMAGGQIWARSLDHVGMTMIFSQDVASLTMVTKSNEAISYDTKDGLIQRRHTYHEAGDNSTGELLPAPLAAAISPDLAVVALMHRGHSVSLWSLESDDLIGTCDRDSGAGDPNISVQTALFSPNPDLSLLVVVYQDGDLVLFEPWMQEQVKYVAADALSIASSQDGRTLATGGSSGIVQIFDFESLELMYRINSYDVEVRSLAFSRDGLRLIDVRDTKSKIWEPACLVRKLADEEASLSDMTPLPATVVGTRDDELVGITAIACHPSASGILVGRDDGTVCVFDTSTGKQASMLYNHGKNVFITTVMWEENGLIVSAGAGSKVTVCRVERPSGENWTLSEKIFETRLDQPIKQLLLSPDGSRLLISATTSQTLWSLAENPGSLLGSLYWKQQGLSKWISAPGYSDEIMLFAGTEARFYKWYDLSDSVTMGPIQLEYGQKALSEEVQLTSLMSTASGEHLVADFRHCHGDQSTVRMALWNMTSLSGSASKEIIADPVYKHINEYIRCILGFNGSRLVFLDRMLWISSVDVKVYDGSCYIRHFFMPSDFLGGDVGVLASVTSERQIVFLSRMGNWLLLQVEWSLRLL